MLVSSIYLEWVSFGVTHALELVWTDSAVLGQPCIWLLDVKCALRKNKSVLFMEQCSSCIFFKQFQLEADLEEERVMDEIEKIRKYGYARRLAVPKEEK